MDLPSRNAWRGSFQVRRRRDSPESSEESSEEEAKLIVRSVQGCQSEVYPTDLPGGRAVLALGAMVEDVEDPALRCAGPSHGTLQPTRSGVRMALLK